MTHWGGDHASRVLPFAAGCGYEAYPDDDSWDTREESILERRSRLNAARQTRLSDLCAAITPDKDDSLEARQRRLFQIDVKSRPRSATPKKDYAIYGPALLDVSTAEPAAPRHRPRNNGASVGTTPWNILCEWTCLLQTPGHDHHRHLT